MSRTDTRERIIEAGRETIARHGFGTTGINAVLQSAGVPKGSFYYYFPSKQDFGLAVIDAVAEDYSRRLADVLEDRSRPPLDRLKAYFQEGIRDMEDADCAGGCLIGNLGQELASHSEVFRARLDRVLSHWERSIARCLEEAREAGELRGCSSDCAALASFILSGWEGAVLRAKVTRSTQPLERFVTLLFGQLLPAH